ncbi:unnamed protein product [Strongylus vulgaris]|uniref:RanBD1 domain-containing protein n=1 Tax=Strongylus vulgaris TaxID=40348 RepID=A0A3P7IIK9_STRVU|nr:unnamed protein product [Strongylus vulgaris]
MTGEENDINIFQTACKLHSFDKEKKTWVERGLSLIRLNQRNEDGEVHHRIVARTTGNHRVVINSKIHADMLFDRVDSKRLKISATSPDSNAMQIFLVTIGFSKTALNSDEFCTTLEGLIKKEKANEALKRKRKASDEHETEKVAKMRIKGKDGSDEEGSTEENRDVVSPSVESGNAEENQSLQDLSAAKDEDTKASSCPESSSEGKQQPINTEETAASSG